MNYVCRMVGVALALLVSLAGLSGAGDGAARARKAYAEGYALYTKGEFQKAAERFTEAAEASPAFVNAWHARASCWHRLGRYEKALADYDRAVKLSPKNAALRVDRGAAHEANGDWLLAHGDYSSAIKLAPTMSQAWRGRARAALIPATMAADEAAADVYDGGVPPRAAEGELEKRLVGWLGKADRLTVVLSVPQFEEDAPVRVYVRAWLPVKGGGEKAEAAQADFLSAAVWERISALLRRHSCELVDLSEWDAGANEMFKEARGVRLAFEMHRPLEVPVAPGRGLKLTRRVLEHFRVQSRSNYPSKRTALIVTEAHSSLDQQLASYRGLDALLEANPWLKKKGEAAFLTEAWEAGKELKIDALLKKRPAPGDELVEAALGTYLIPSYVALKWKRGLDVPLIGHEDMKLYRLCNYLHWGCESGKWMGDEYNSAYQLTCITVQGRNKSSREALLRSLADYTCPILFIGHGHIGPHPGHDDQKAPGLVWALDVTSRLKGLLPDEPADWAARYDGRSVAWGLKDAGVGYIVLAPRVSPLLDADTRRAHSASYAALRKAQHDGKYEAFTRAFWAPAAGCTTMPAPDALASIIPDLERDGLPGAADYAPARLPERLAEVLGDCGTSLGCFPAGTAVHTEAGKVAIEHVRPGQRVWGCDPVTGAWGLRRVTAATSAEYAGAFVRLTTASGEVTATGSHPFWERSGGGHWARAGDLRVGDELACRVGGAEAIRAVARFEGKRRVYRLSVAGVNTFAVGTAGLLVHNACRRVPQKLQRDPAFARRLAAGGKPPKNCAAHHLIPVAEARDSKLMRAAARLGYDINNPRNGVFLPRDEKTARKMGLPLHRGPHPAYSASVARRLKNLDAAFAASGKPGGGEKWNSDRILSKVRGLERAMARELRDRRAGRLK